MRKLFSNQWKNRKAQSYKFSNKNDHFFAIKLFVVYLHIINEFLSNKFHPYSILTGHTKVESVAYYLGVIRYSDVTLPPQDDRWR